MANIIREQPVTKTLAEIVRREVEAYAGGGVGGKGVAVSDDARHRYTVIAILDKRDNDPLRVILMAEVVGEYVLILEDRTDKPLVDALIVNGGIPRDKIVLAFAGETLPAPTDS
jgi:hypothetical protein